MKRTHTLLVATAILMTGCGKSTPSDPTVHESRTINVGGIGYKRDYEGPKSSDPFIPKPERVAR